jgi:hypothetical protein
MTRLTVRVKNDMYDRRDRFGCHIVEYNDYTGEVYPNPKWVDSDLFCLTTGDEAFPFRIISKENIIHGWLLPDSGVGVSYPSKVSAQEASSITYQVQSKGKTYLVTRSGRKLSCNCTGFSYRRTCSHVKEIANG